MNPTQSSLKLATLLALIVGLMPFHLSAQTTAFTYQGFLTELGAPANGTHDFEFKVYDALAAGAQQGSTVTLDDVGVTNGLFTVTLDFGASVFDGSARWLDIAVRPGASAGAYTNVSPRQPITATPYAIKAGNYSGTVQASQLAGTISANNIGAGSITTVMLANGAVGAGQLAAGAVTTPALADGAVTGDKMFKTNDWFLRHTILKPTPDFGDWFGSALASVGPDKVLIGAHRDDAGAGDAGAAYLFSTDGILLTTFTNPTPEVSDQFGFAVAGVGTDKVLIGALFDDTGAAKAGAAYLFSTDGTLLTTFTNPTPEDFDWFGNAVAGVGTDKVLIGAYGDNTGASESGAAYLFGTDGTLLTTFTNPTPAFGDSFGHAVAGVGTDKVLIGAHRDDAGAAKAGAAYLFSTDGTLLTTFTNPTPAVDDWFGYAVAGVDPDRVLIGALFDDTGAGYAGAAYLFSTDGTLLTTFTNPTPENFDGYGSALAGIGPDRVLIGARLDIGAAYLFSTNGVLLTTFTNPTPAFGDSFGYAVAGVGTDKVLIGAHLDDTGSTEAGAAYLFSIESYTPDLLASDVLPNSIAPHHLTDGGVTASKLAVSAVTSTSIADGTVAAADLNVNTFNTTFWRTAGNAGTIAGTHFIGTTDNQPLQLKVNNQVGLRLMYPAFVGSVPNVVGGFSGNSVGPETEGAVISGGGASGFDENIIGANSAYSAIGGGQGNKIGNASLNATIAGGYYNNIGVDSARSVIGGGSQNSIVDNSSYATIAGGWVNDIGMNSDYSFIGGGYDNNIAAGSIYATIAGGVNNNIGVNADYSAIGGGAANSIADNSFHATIPGGVNNNIGINADQSMIGGGAGNTIMSNSMFASISGGYLNTVSTNSYYGSIGGGVGNTVSGHSSVIGGGTNNMVNASGGFLGGGENNTIGGSWGVLGGGQSNINRGIWGMVGGGTLNTITNGSGNVIGGGFQNTIGNSATGATIPGGSDNTARASYAFASGYRAKANHSGAFVWGDENNSDVVSTNDNSVTFRASGGVRFFSSASTTAPAPGVYLAPGGSSWGSISDRNAKKDFALVDGVAVLEKLAQVPVQRWHYQWEETSATPHLGPMAQDFKAAFYPGRDDKSITTLEFDGVALAAIQGLNQKTEDRSQKAEARIQKLETENAELKQRLSALEKLLNRLSVAQSGGR